MSWQSREFPSGRQCGCWKPRASSPWSPAKELRSGAYPGPDVVELFDVREALEVFATRRAAVTATTADLRRLKQALDKARIAVDAGDPKAAGSANDIFHDLIIVMARNGLLAGMLEPLQGRLHWLFRQVDDLDSLWEEHRELYDAIASGEPDRAGAQALQHVQANRDIALALLFGDNSPSVVPG